MSLMSPIRYNQRAISFQIVRTASDPISACAVNAYTGLYNASIFQREANYTGWATQNTNSPLTVGLIDALDTVHSVVSGYQYTRYTDSSA